MLWCCMWGRGREGAMVPAPLSTGFESLPPLPAIKLGPSGAGSRMGGLVHTLGPCGSLQPPVLWGWESLLLPPQPPRALSVRGLRLYFLVLEPWVTWSASLPAIHPGLSVHECGPQGLLVVRLPAPFIPHSTNLIPAMATWVLSAPPTGLDVCFFFIYLVLDFLAVWFSASSGWARRRSVSTYATILVLPDITFLILPNNPIKQIPSPFYRLERWEIKQLVESRTGIQACL